MMVSLEFLEKNKIYIIAEAGVNHNGDLAIAKKLVDAAKKAGADCVKFQTFKAEKVVTASAPKAHYQLEVTAQDESQLHMLQKLELDLDAHKELINYCKKLNIDFLSTPYNIEDVAFLEELGVSAYKVASGQIIEPSFLRAVSRTGKPVFVSTGMATLAEVDDAVRVIRETGNEQVVLLQCTTNYPSRLEDANLRAIPTMAAACGTVMGYSDHTQSDTACLVSLGLGAQVIEKHLTLDKSLPGPDHSASAEPAEFTRLVAAVREAEKTFGTGRKEPCAVEIENSPGMRRSIVAASTIRCGDVFREELLTFKRPGTGIKPALLSELIGCVATRDVEMDELISWEMCGERL